MPITGTGSPTPATWAKDCVNEACLASAGLRPKAQSTERQGTPQRFAIMHKLRPKSAISAIEERRRARLMLQMPHIDRLLLMPQETAPRHLRGLRAGLESGQ